MKTGIYTERGRGKIERGREKIIGKKEENSSPPVGLEPTTSCLHGQGATRAKGEPKVVGRESPVEEHCWRS